ncbi:TolC family protein [Geobacter argillaceus]|uniref:Outer membrane protein TolC n=1 Tax=Geobacter argillaceus TaxID=345631 RepID=A0A562VHL1_9BACT|nr:TolC family protein [Geobacter argillaceus]TWJ17338.1 outer membrane protein TolC [Geobacter argillaceus]
MRNKFLSILLFFAMALPAEGRVVTVEECIRLASGQSSSLKAYDALSRVAGEDLKISRTGFLPSLTFKGSYSLFDKADRLIINGNTFAPGIPASDVTVSTGDRYAYSFGLILKQPLYTGGNLIHGYRRAEHHSRAAEFDTARQRRLLTLQVRQSFNEVLITESQVRAAEKGIRAREERLRVVRERLAEGYADREEVLRQEAELAMAQTRLIRAKSRGEIAMSRLRKLIQAGPGEELSVVGSPVKVTLGASLNELMTSGLEQREDLKVLQERVETADEGVGAARSGFLPQVYLEGGYYRQKETNVARPELWQATVQAEWSLFEWGRTAATVRRATAQRQQLSYSREELARNVRLEIEESWREVAEQQSLVLAQEKQVRAVEAALGKSVDRFGTGAARYDEALANEAGLWDAFDSYYQGVVSLGNALALLEANTATELGTWTVSSPLYQPDFDYYEKLMQKELDSRRPAPPAVDPLPTSQHGDNAEDVWSELETRLLMQNRRGEGFLVRSSHGP